MAHLLHVDSSPLSQGSVSKALGAAFRRAWAEEQPDDAVVYRDLGADPVPHLDEAGVTWQFVPAEYQSPQQQSAGKLRETLAAELVAADALLVTAPLYNWTLPSQLKAWIDQVAVAGSVIEYGDGPKPLADRPATVLLAYGGDFSEGSVDAQYDALAPYLKTVLGYTLGLDVTVISAQLTLAEAAPWMAHLADQARQSRADAERAAEERAREVSRLLSKG
jgi:FMN-dependent NADH-azoreductase